MPDEHVGDVTQHLRAVAMGQAGAADALMRLVYDELRILARGRMTGRWGPGALQPTALVHETYLRLFGKEFPNWENRRHFFWAAARAMRDILVENARYHAARKRGGGQRPADIDLEGAAISESEDYLALDEAIERLHEKYPDAAKVVMLRFFSGLTREETAEVMGISPAAVWRDWCFAKAWLKRFLAGESEPGREKEEK